ncbi:625_t:CDS:1, partial [Racocetra persica]
MFKYLRQTESCDQINNNNQEESSRISIETIQKIENKNTEYDSLLSEYDSNNS